ncbi:MAG: ribosomal-processing cysteine protease Prp [Eubacteriales bacterium]|nr:ribosomal-processing cysteine protease Prp [Eubacteriales bacterium]
MISITVKKRNGSYVGFTSKGHAGYGQAGEDIVCAAVSALVINTVNSLERFTEERFSVREKDGFVSVDFEEYPNTDQGKLLMDSLILGLTEIEHDYSSRYLTVTVKEV